MKTLGLVVSDKKSFENCILKINFWPLWPTYATNWNGLNNFDRGSPKDHSCEVWSKSNKRRRCCLKKLLTHGRTDARTDNGRRTLKDHKRSLSTSCSGELKRGGHHHRVYNAHLWIIFALTSKFVELISPAEQVLLIDGRWRNLGKGVCKMYEINILPVIYCFRRKYWNLLKLLKIMYLINLQLTEYHSLSIKNKRQ